ncbi:hypothetical protein BDN70DRAFT_856012 [Pholiota conissans]|uniref:Aminoglycoside phosphotransferase domain-containing protein n=1 Tax=Pholiota conissans TaxID=109636 RepID=A0A9P5Z4G1_9AGAR|nr:hypothetical protein BDN70DRAFT_856012 [Pholiota conissans]
MSIYNPIDWAGVDDPWDGVTVNLEALHTIVCEVFRIPAAQCGPPVAIGLHHRKNYASVYSFQLPLRKVVARLVAPIKPLFKTEGEVAAMDFVRGRTSLPIPKVFAYCSEANNPVGVEWLLMEHVPGVEIGEAWDSLTFPQKRRLALDIVDIYDQLSRLKADGIGSIYHNTVAADDAVLLTKSSMSMSHNSSGTRRWAPLSSESLRLLKGLCKRSVKDGYNLGPLNEISLLKYELAVPSPSQTPPTFSSEDYFKLIAYNGNPPTRSDYDLPTREKFVELFHRIYNLYPTSQVLGPSSDSANFRFSHGDLHEGNIFIDPTTGAITGIIDWEAAGFRPLWTSLYGVGWFDEDSHRFISTAGGDDPAPSNFADDTPEDTKLRAFFRRELYRRNPDLFASFLGGIEMRAVMSAAADDPRPIGESDIFLRDYHDMGCWNVDRRGPFPWNMHAWLLKRLEFDAIERVSGENTISNISLI